MHINELKVQKAEHMLSNSILCLNLFYSSNMMMMTYSFTINIPTDNSGFYFIGHLMVEGLKLCRYIWNK